MSFNFQEIENAVGSGSATATLSTGAATGDLLVGTVSLATASDETGIQPPAGWTQAGVEPASDRVLAVYYREASSGDTSFPVSHSDGTQSITVTITRYSKSGPILSVASGNGISTNVASITVGPVSSASGALSFAIARKSGTLSTSTGFSDGFDYIAYPDGLLNGTNRFWVGDKISTLSTESVTHNLESPVTRQSAVIVTFTEDDPNAPSITDINTNNELTPGTTAAITGTNLANTTGVTVGGEVQTDVTVVSATEVTFTVVRGGNPYNQDLTAQLTSTDGTASITVQQVPEAGTFAVTAASPNTTDDASLWTGLIDTATSDPITIVDGDQAWVKNPNNLTNLAVAPDGTITADTEGNFVVQIWLASEGVWGSDQTVTFTEDPGGDVTGPTITSVNVPTAGSYGIGDNLPFTVNFDEAAIVTGTPRLPVNLTTGTVYADYASGTGTTALVFTATVQEGDNDADGITLGVIELNGGTIRDASANNATLILAGVENTAGILVDGVRPVITVLGDNPYNMTVGETFNDQGATASDNQDGNLGAVTGTGTVDGGTEGQYTRTYPGAGVVDSAGNVALDATRTVNVNAAPGPDDWLFSKGIKYAATKNWTWGNRHPKTGTRVRIFK